MLFFNKKANPNLIEDIGEILEKFNDEFNQCSVPKEVSCLWYLGGNETLDTLCENELNNFDLHKLFDYKKISLKECLEGIPKIRTSFFYALNNIKNHQNFEDNEALLEFLKDKGKFFVNDYLKGFQKSAEYYNKKFNKGKLPEYRELLTWVENEELYFIDKFFVYFGKFKINLNNIIACYKDEELARTVLKYKDDEIEKEMYFNLAAFSYFEKLGITSTK